MDQNTRPVTNLTYLVSNVPCSFFALPRVLSLPSSFCGSSHQVYARGNINHELRRWRNEKEEQNTLTIQEKCFFLVFHVILTKIY